MNRAVKELQRLCRAWGGDLILMPRRAFELLEHYDRSGARMFTPAPASSFHGLNWDAKLVFATHEDVNAGSVIHEMGHVFASDVSERDCDEWSWLGWEIRLAQQVGAYRVWSKQNEAYVMGDYDGLGVDGEEWGTITSGGRRAVARDRIAAGKRFRIINRSGRPIAIR